MFILYVDESGDVGTKTGSSPYFILSGLVLHELRWRSTLDSLVAMRRRFRAQYTLKLREEIHAVDLIQHPGDLARIPRWQRLLMLGDVANTLATFADISVINVVFQKSKHPATVDVFERAWTVLIQRFHNTIAFRNFPGPANADDRGLLVTDATDGEKLRKLVRRLRVFNPVPNQIQYGQGSRQIPLDTLVEDPIPRDSRHSFFLQSCDVVAYLLKQRLQPNKFFRARGAQNYFDRLTPILCRKASSSDPQGIVRL